MDYLNEQLGKCKNDRHIYKLLYKIRTQYIAKENDIENFVSNNGLTRLSSLLSARINLETSQENDRIIEVLLSILGNCTFYKSSAAKAYNANIAEHVIALINKTDDNVLKAKSCRLLGNLAQHEKSGLKLQQFGAALCLSNCLSDEATPLLLTMAVRAIRLLWSSRKFRFEILSFGSIVKIVSCLQSILKKTSDTGSDNDDDDGEEDESKIVIFRRSSEPDRVISKEKLSTIIEKMEKHDCRIEYEIMKPEKKKRTEYALPSTKENVEVVSGILKSLLTISATSLPQVARSLLTGMSCFLFLIEESAAKLRPTCLKILSNLSYNPFAQEYLGINNELIPTICNLLVNSAAAAIVNEEKPLDQNEQKYCLDILCLSSENACNRLKLRRSSGVFKTMLSIANTTTIQSELNLLIFAFYQFRFDEDGLNSLIQLNLVNVLIKILADIVEAKEVDHININDPSLDEERKEEQRFKLQQQQQQQQQRKRRASLTSSSSFNCVNKFMRYDSGSPSHSSGYGSTQLYSPTRSTSGYSPFNSPIRSYNDYDSDSNQYSPVCSDNEDDEATPVQNDFDILDYLYNNDEIGKNEDSEQKKIAEIDEETTSLTLNEETSEAEEEDDEEKEDIDKSDSSPSKKSENIPETLKSIQTDQLQFILLLLWKVSIKHSDQPAFTRPSNLSTLIKVCALVQKPNGKSYQILKNVLEQTRNFVPILLKQDLVFQINELSHPIYNHRNCYSCSKMKVISRELLRDLKKVAESGYGVGEITHSLLTNDDEAKNKIAIKLLYVISSSEILNQFLFKYRALDIIMNIIFANNTTTSLSVEACNGITIMSNNLNIQIPSEDDVLQRIIPDEFIEDEKLLESEGELVKFICKDGEVSFDKEVLKSSSEVFHSMLTGHFRESNCNEVNFPNYTVLGMKYFFQLMKMEMSGKLKQIAPRVDDMDVILQAYELSILYILVNIQLPLLNVIKIVLDDTSVRKIFEWSLKNINQDLLISSICYYLCSDIDGKAKLKIFQEVNDSTYSKEWRDLIIDCISSKCKPQDD